MIVSPDVLRRETVQLMKTVEKEMQKFEDEGRLRHISPFQVKDANGNALYATLVAARLSGLNAVALLNEQGKKP